MRSWELLKRFRSLRWALFLALLVPLYFFVLKRYRYTRLPPGPARAMVPALDPRAKQLVDLDPPRALIRHWVVFWATRSRRKALSRIHGLPGDRFRKKEDRWHLEDEGGRTHSLPRGLELGPDWVERRLLPGEYFLLNDDLETDLPDSRGQGPVPRSHILGHVLFL